MKKSLYAITALTIGLTLCPTVTLPARADGWVGRTRTLFQQAQDIKEQSRVRSNEINSINSTNRSAAPSKASTPTSSAGTPQTYAQRQPTLTPIEQVEIAGRRLVVSYCRHEGDQKDLAEALNHNRHIATTPYEANFWKALESQLQGGIPVETKLYDKANASALQQRAEAGDAEAKYRLAKMYKRGVGVPRDGQKAAELLQEAVDMDHAEATRELSAMYASGTSGVTQDKDKAEALTKKYLVLKSVRDSGEVTNPPTSLDSLMQQLYKLAKKTTRLNAQAGFDSIEEE